MYTAEVVVGEVQAVRGPQILPLLTEGIRQACQAAHLHSDGEVLALHDGSADTGRIAVSEDWHYLRIDHFGRRVARFAVHGLPIDFDELGEACNPIFERIGDRSNVGSESVRRDLEFLTR